MTRTVKRNRDRPYRCPECQEICVLSIPPLSLDLLVTCPECDVRWWPGLLWQYGLRARHHR
jgi:hypothetical protein